MRSRTLVANSVLYTSASRAHAAIHAAIYSAFGTDRFAFDVGRRLRKQEPKSGLEMKRCSLAL